MGAWFPDWQHFEAARERQVPAGRGFVREPVIILVWEGELQPLPDDPSEATNILADLAADRDVLVAQGGTLQHLESCMYPHNVPESIHAQGEYGVRFLLQAEHLAPPAHPNVYSLRPYLSPELYNTQGHINRDGTLCPFTGTDDGWNGGRDTLAAYLKRGVAILLAKHLYWQWIWEATSNGIWPGWSGPHGEVQAALEAMKRPPTVQCRCGSGRPHGVCHRPLDERIEKDPIRYILQELDWERR